jgi:hypothetical protein
MSGPISWLLLRFAGTDREGIKIKETMTKIIEELICLLNKKFMIPTSALKADDWDEPLTGSVMKLTGVDMVYLFFETEKYFQISIDKQYLMSYGFCSIRQIAKIIENIISNKRELQKSEYELNN